MLKQSRARGVLVQDRYRNRDLVAVVDSARKTLPDFREMIPLSTWTEFVKTGKTAQNCRQSRLTTQPNIEYTSGTTGRPKGARLTHRGLTNNARIYARTYRSLRIGHLGQSNADVSHCGMRPLRARSVANRRTHVLPPVYAPGTRSPASSKKSVERSRFACRRCSL